MNKVKAIAGRVPMRPGYRVVFTGEGEDMIESFGYMAEALLLAVIFVYLILAAQFESFIEPFSIMLSLPLSIVGMAGMLLLTGDTVNIMSLIGLIMLMGLVTKNAILARGLREGAADAGDGADRGGNHGGQDEAAAHPDDDAGDDLRMLPLALGSGRGGGAGADGAARRRGAGHVDLPHAARRAGRLHPAGRLRRLDAAEMGGEEAAAGAVVGLLILLLGSLPSGRGRRSPPTPPTWTS